MNERIKELWSQAGGHYNGGNQHTWPEYTITDPEKFAELIVRECMEQLNISNVPTSISAGLNLGRVAIKEHFGVEK